jgi:hypothetical protein
MSYWMGQRENTARANQTPPLNRRTAPVRSGFKIMGVVALGLMGIVCCVFQYIAVGVILIVVDAVLLFLFFAPSGWNPLKWPKSTQPSTFDYGPLGLSLGLLVVVGLLLATISCSIRPGATYERFDDALGTQINQSDLTQQLKKATALLQKDEVLLDQSADRACDVYKQVSDALVKNDAAPTPDMIQPIDQSALNARAQSKFEDTKRTYMAKNGDQTMLECFASQEASAVETELRAAVLALDAQLNASNMKLKARKVTATLGFTAPYVQETVKAFSEGFYGTEGSTDSTASTIKTATGKDLVAKGLALYNEAMKVHATIQEQPGVAALQKEALAAVNAKKEKLNNPSPEETAHFAEEGTDPKYAD